MTFYDDRGQPIIEVRLQPRVVVLQKLSASMNDFAINLDGDAIAEVSKGAKAR